MKLTISQKLFLAFLGLTLLVLAATLGLARWSFERGFLDYVNALEQKRLQTIAEVLAQEYREAGNDWHQMAPGVAERSLFALPGHPRRPSGHPPHRPPPHNKKRPPHGQRKHPPPKRHPPPGFPKKGPATALLDTNEQLIAGHLPDTPDTKRFQRPIIVDDKTVGYLVSQPRRRFDSPQETAFSRQQLMTSLLIGIASLLLAAVISWWLARLLVAPVQRMIGGVKRLSDGDYETRLQHKNHDELGQLSTDINHLAATLEENRHSRRRWLADISHELRTPVTILTGEIAALQEGIRPFNQQQLRSLGHEVERLRHLIDDLYQLSLSDMGALRYDFAPCQLADNLERVVSSLAPKAQQQNIQINTSIDKDLLINADSGRIDQLLTNLLNNSLAYTDTPGVLDISLQQRAQQIVLELNDTPPGVNAEECERLFEPLYRRDESRNRRTAGAGLGLAICQNIVKAHRATITATPSASGGLCITVSFPVFSG